MVGIHRHGDNLLGKALEGTEKAARILGCKRAADDHERPLHFVFQLRHRLRERAPGILVMAAVKPDIRACRSERRHMTLGEILQTRWPLHVQ
ncbi:MAG: hypothetical protein USCAAHI_03224 [Beijerinckiaceae bacterium]|nr:MAG: hypothetical protein USCAAHI_03224 [Beijerinckiaceae bacterium]